MTIVIRKKISSDNIKAYEIQGFIHDYYNNGFIAQENRDTYQRGVVPRSKIALWDANDVVKYLKSFDDNTKQMISKLIEMTQSTDVIDLKKYVELVKFAKEVFIRHFSKLTNEAKSILFTVFNTASSKLQVMRSESKPDAMIPLAAAATLLTLTVNQLKSVIDKVNKLPNKYSDEISELEEESKYNTYVGMEDPIRAQINELSKLAANIIIVNENISSNIEVKIDKIKISDFNKLAAYARYMRQNEGDDPIIVPATNNTANPILDQSKEYLSLIMDDGFHDSQNALVALGLIYELSGSKSIINILKKPNISDRVIGAIAELIQKGNDVDLFDQIISQIESIEKYDLFQSMFINDVNYEFLHNLIEKNIDNVIFMNQFVNGTLNRISAAVILDLLSKYPEKFANIDLNLHKVIGYVSRHIDDIIYIIESLLNSGKPEQLLKYINQMLGYLSYPMYAIKILGKYGNIISSNESSVIAFFKDKNVTKQMVKEMNWQNIISVMKIVNKYPNLQSIFTGIAEAIEDQLNDRVYSLLLKAIPFTQEYKSILDSYRANVLKTQEDAKNYIQKMVEPQTANLPINNEQPSKQSVANMIFALRSSR